MFERLDLLERSTLKKRELERASVTERTLKIFHQIKINLLKLLIFNHKKLQYRPIGLRKGNWGFGEEIKKKKLEFIYIELDT